LYGSLIVGPSIGTTSCWYHGGINMCGSNVGHPNDPTSGLNGGPPSESLSCPPYGGWWVELLVA